eukprot:1104404_1
MAKLSEDEIRIALVNLSSHNIELESLECSQKKFPNVKWRMWKQSYSKNSKSRYHDGYVCAKSDDPAYAQTNGWISRKCTRKYDQRANRSHFTRNKTHWKLHTDAKVGLRKVSKFHYVTSNDDRNICVFGEERIKRKEQKSLRLMMHQQKAKCEEKAPILDHTIDTQTVLSDEDVLRDPLDTIDTIDTISGKKRTLHEFINSEMNHNQTTHERPNKKDALFAVIDNTEEIYHDIIDKQYIERAAKSIVQPLQTLLKDNPTISARQAKQLIGIDDLPRKTKKLVWKKAWSMINDKDK